MSLINYNSEFIDKHLKSIFLSYKKSEYFSLYFNKIENIYKKKYERLSEINIALLNFFLKEIIREKFLNRYKTLEEKFRKSEFLYLLIYRFVGGIPFQIQNILPCIFNVKVSNLFWSTFLGMMPSLFLIISIGSGLEEIIDQNLEAPKMIDLITSPSIYIPMIAFFVLLGITIFFRKMFYKN